MMLLLVLAHTCMHNYVVLCIHPLNLGCMCNMFLDTRTVRFEGKGMGETNNIMRIRGRRQARKGEEEEI